ncbi:MAG: hypothetical protein OHK0046_31140 [Anaerolineae bacterium]
MTTFERRQTIVRLVNEWNSVKVTDLAKMLHVSEGTIRNDLEALDEDHQLIRVRGGAVATSYRSAPVPVTNRARVNWDAKRRIAEWTSGMIENGDVILLDSSTTVLHIASFLQDRRHLTVVTNGVEVARLLAENPTNTVILLGGVLRPNGNTVAGLMSERLLHGLHINTAFISCAGFSVASGLMENDLQEAELKQAMVQAAKRTIALVDASKNEKVGVSVFANLSAIEYFVTDDGMPEPVIEHLRQANTHVIVCGENTVSTLVPRDTPTTRYRIGFANLSERLAFARDVRRGLEQAAQDTNTIELIVADNQLNGDIALQVADNLLQQQVDLVIEYQIDETMGNRIVHKFSHSDVPVIAVDIPMVGATFFGVDNFAVGYVAGRALGEAVQREWNGQFDHLVILQHPRAGYLPASRIQGQFEGFTEVVGDVAAERILYLECGNTTEISQEQMSDLLQTLPERQRLAVICFNDEAAVGALWAARALGRERELLLVGQGCDRILREELRTGRSRIVGSTAFKPEQYGARLVELAMKILRGEPVPPAVYMDHTFVTAQNVDMLYPNDNA